MTEQGASQSLPPEEQLLSKLSWCCKQFRENTADNAFPQESHPVIWLIREIREMIAQFSETRFVKGIQALGILSLPLMAEGVFYCLCELFLTKPLEPVNSSPFISKGAEFSFCKGIETLVGRGLVIAVAVNKSEESKATKDNYLLSPDVCRELFRGREDLIRPTVVAQFGTLTLWRNIPVKELVFSDTLCERLGLITRAVASDRFDQVVAELVRNGFRGSVTALLFGPPGTGKTEFVRQLARYTQRNLFQIDGAKLDASYYGEKPRNLRDLFRLIRYASAISTLVPIVFIDEADGLLGRRVGVERAIDKEENSAVNIILEELNTFSGILFAATNHIANLDPAMSRRFLIKAEFPVPGRDVLARIWRAKIPWLTAEEAASLADRSLLSGGVIDNVAALCILEKIIDGKAPTLDQILRLCAEQGGQGRPSPIGFKR